MRRVVRFLRSRTLAIWLLLACVAWFALGTSVPQASNSSAAEIARWSRAHPAAHGVAKAIGLDHAYSSPLMLVVLALLSVSTAACSVQRTSHASRLLAKPSGVPEGRARALEGVGAKVVTGRNVPSPEAIIDSLATLGLKSRRTRTVIQADGGKWGPVGSPIFHWALTLLIAVIALGQLTRAEGQIGVPVGSELRNTPSEYGQWSAGPLHGAANAGLTVAVSAMRADLKRGSVDIGAAPTVELKRAGRVVASGRVYPNHPLRYGSLLVHMAGTGYTAVVEIFGADGASLGTRRVYFDLASGTKTGVGPAQLDLTYDGKPYRVAIQPLPRAASGGKRRMDVRFALRSGEPTAVVVLEGDRFALGDLGALRVTKVARYARLSIADDWSIYPMYALFGLAVAGIAIAVFVPRKTVWVLLPKDGRELRYLTYHQRKEPVFDILVEDALLAACGGAQQADRDDREEPDRR